ncbi:UDP-N-acetylglucosamine pyrophosphorylase [Theileria orientalis]|uniref:UDP-N-acetylglucosamine diphosphorylase n=1 Tax=Theileria orientalis TaxID=68886 RepID=A0A976M9V2_THEOR|nr:UDP-N-acetylglucosamine pyrophosphorylase [Theileria orientalis]
MENYREHLKDALNRKYKGKFRPFKKSRASEDAETGTYVEESETEQFEELGRKTIRNGQAAIVILAGGLSTRIGSCEPKSILPVTAVKNKSLLQLHLEKLRKLFTLVDVEEHPFIFILTCSFNYSQIESFLKRNLHFGLDPKCVILLVQSNLPCFIGDELEYSRYPSSELNTPRADVIDFSKNEDFDNFYTRGFRLDVKYEGIVTSPNGNGNVFETLHENEEFMKILPRIKCLHVIGVDNCLSRPLDPALVGMMVHTQGLDMLNKCVLRSHGENLGVFCVGDFPRIIEYSELDRLTENGLKDYEFYGNICDHMFSSDFMSRAMSQQLYKKLPLHAAKKRIPVWSYENGRFVFPSECNGYKLELFVFDVMEFTSKVMCVAVDRDLSFAPLKTSWDCDMSNESAIQYKMDKVFKSWLRRVDCIVDGICEISPTLSYSGENLEEYRGKLLKGPAYIE